MILFLTTEHWKLLQKSQTDVHQWAAKGRHRSTWKFFRSLNRMAASMYTNRIHSDTVGRQTPLSAWKEEMRGKKHQVSREETWQLWISCTLSIWGESGHLAARREKQSKKKKQLGLTCVPDILDPYVGAGSKKQPLDGDEEEAYDVWCKRNTHKEDGECLKTRGREKDGDIRCFIFQRAFILSGRSGVFRVITTKLLPAPDIWRSRRHFEWKAKRATDTQSGTRAQSQPAGPTPTLPGTSGTGTCCGEETEENTGEKGRWMDRWKKEIKQSH